jgi:hypothetical protein
MNAQVQQQVEPQAPTAKKKDPTPVLVVKMSDGREVDFVGKRKLVKESTIDEHGKVSVRLDFRNGETRLFHLPHTLLNQFAAHGAEQKLGDETAGTEDVDDMVVDVDDLIERLHKGEWNVKREGGGFAGISILMAALIEVSGKTQEQIKLFLSTKTQADKMALRNSPKIKPVVEKLEAAKLAKGTKVDVKALEDELNSI